MSAYILPADDPRLYADVTFYKPEPGIGDSDMEDQPQHDTVIPNRWSREWIGEGDWHSDSKGYPQASADSLGRGEQFRWISKRREEFTIDGDPVSGRWWSKYLLLSSSRGRTFPGDFTSVDGRTIYHREIHMHWMWDALVWFRHDFEPWTLELREKKAAKKRRRSSNEQSRPRSLNPQWV